MKDILKFTIETTDMSLKRQGKSRMFFNGDFKHEVEGIVLEAQYQFDDGYLIFMSYDVPFDEILHVLLLSPDFLIRDQVSLSAQHIACFFGLVGKINDRSLSFTFWDNDPIQLTVRKKSRVRNPLSSIFSNVRRPFGFKTWLDVEHPFLAGSA